MLLRNYPFTRQTAVKFQAQTRSAAARQVSNAHERDLVTNQNVLVLALFRSDVPFGKSFFPIQFASSWEF